MLSLRTAHKGKNGANCGKIADSAVHLRLMARKIVLTVGRLARLPEWSAACVAFRLFASVNHVLPAFRNVWNSLHDDKNDCISDAWAQNCPRPFAFDPRGRLRAKCSGEPAKDAAAAIYRCASTGSSREDANGRTRDETRREYRQSAVGDERTKSRSRVLSPGAGRRV